MAPKFQTPFTVLKKSLLFSSALITNLCTYLLINSFNRFLQVSPMQKKTGHKIPHIALSLSVYQNSLKADDILSAVFELSMYNHSKGTYHGCKGSFCQAQTYYKWESLFMLYKLRP